MWTKNPVHAVPVHPTQLYEMGLSTLVFAVLWRMGRHDHANGWLFALWLALAGLERFAVEFFRANHEHEAWRIGRCDPCLTPFTQNGCPLSIGPGTPLFLDRIADVDFTVSPDAV